MPGRKGKLEPSWPLLGDLAACRETNDGGITMEIGMGLLAIAGIAAYWLSRCQFF